MSRQKTLINCRCAFDALHGGPKINQSIKNNVNKNQAERAWLRRQHECPRSSRRHPSCCWRIQRQVLKINTVRQFKGQLTPNFNVSLFHSTVLYIVLVRDWELKAPSPTIEKMASTIKLPWNWVTTQRTARHQLHLSHTRARTHTHTPTHTHTRRLMLNRVPVNSRNAWLKGNQTESLDIVRNWTHLIMIFMRNALRFVLLG